MPFLETCTHFGVVQDHVRVTQKAQAVKANPASQGSGPRDFRRLLGLLVFSLPKCSGQTCPHLLLAAKIAFPQVCQVQDLMEEAGMTSFGSSRQPHQPNQPKQPNRRATGIPCMRFHGMRFPRAGLASAWGPAPPPRSARRCGADAAAAAAGSSAPGASAHRARGPLQRTAPGMPMADARKRLAAGMCWSIGWTWLKWPPPNPKSPLRVLPVSCLGPPPPCARTSGTCCYDSHSRFGSTKGKHLNVAVARTPRPNPPEPQ